MRHKRAKELPPEENHNEMVEAAWDDITGEEIDATRLNAARALEMQCSGQLDVFDKVEIAEWWEKTGRAPISTRWVDHDRGTKYISRWAARQFKSDGVDQ